MCTARSTTFLHHSPAASPYPPSRFLRPPSLPPPCAQLADLSHNQLSRLPPSLASLSSLHTLRLSHNALTAEGVPWAALASLSALTCLTLDHNPLGPGPGHTHTAPASTSAPASGGATASTSTPTITQSPGPSQPQRQQAADGPTAAAGTGEGTEAPAAATEGCAAGPCWSLAPGLVQLDVSHCGLAALPRGVGALAALEALAADGNALQELPEELGGAGKGGEGTSRGGGVGPCKSLGLGLCVGNVTRFETAARVWEQDWSFRGTGVGSGHAGVC